MGELPVYEEPTKGMAAMRMRLVRAELQAGCAMSVFNAVLGGDEAIVRYGIEGHPRTTSIGALLSVTVSGEQNSTFSRTIRDDGWVLLSRDGPNHPLRPTSHRLRLHPRIQPVLPNVLALPALPASPPVEMPASINSGMSQTIRNWIWTASTALASGAAAVVTTQGAHRGHKGSMLAGVLISLGSSELTDYPVGSTLWNQTEPLLTASVGNTANTISNATNVATEGIRASLRYKGWLIGGLLVMPG